MLIRWLKGKIRSNQTEGEHKVQTDRNPQVCVCRVCVVGRNGPIRGERFMTSCCGEPIATMFDSRVNQFINILVIKKEIKIVYDSEIQKKSFSFSIIIIIIIVGLNEDVSHTHTPKAV